MTPFISLLTRLYENILLLYPRPFRDEFRTEMLDSFQESVEDAVVEGILPTMLVVSREIAQLPASLAREFRYEFERKGKAMGVNEGSVVETNNGIGKSRRDAALGMMPFLLAGILLMSTKFTLPFHMGYQILAFLTVCLVGLWAGLVNRSPRWAFSYLGWAVVISYWWTQMPQFEFKSLNNPNAIPAIMGLRAWVPLWLVVGLVLLIQRSLRPLRDLTSAIWRDWTLLSLAIYAFVAFVLLVYDENHHPYLLVFMTVSTLAVCLAVWGFLKSDMGWKRIVSLLAGFVTTLVLSNISYATQNYAGYYNLPPSPLQPWYTVFDGVIGWTLLWSGIMFWPALIGIIRLAVNNRRKPGMT